MKSTSALRRVNSLLPSSAADCVVRQFVWQFLLVTLLSVCCLADVPVSDAKAPSLTWGVTGAWRAGSGTDISEKKERRKSAGVGDTLIVEVKNFNGWLLHCSDLYGTVAREHFSGLHEGLEKIVNARLLKRATHASRLMRKVCEGGKDKTSGGLTDAQITEFIDEGLVSRADEPQLKEIHALALKQREPLPANIGFSPVDLVDKVLELPSFASLAKHLPKDADSRVSVLTDSHLLLNRMVREAAGALRLEFNNVEISDIAPENWESTVRKVSSTEVGTDLYHFRFPLMETKANAHAWMRLRKDILFSAPVRVTLTHPFAEKKLALQTLLEIEPQASEEYQFKLVSIRGWQMGLALGLLLLCLGIFVLSSIRTDLLRDTEAPVRVYGLQPYSLSRSQMAFWFFLVIASFLFLWISSGKIHVLNDTCLWLIGIGAGTALGSAMIPKPRNTSAPGEQFIRRNAGENSEEFLQRLKREKEKESDPVILSRLDQQIEATRNGPAKVKLDRILEDWLKDGENYSFHRYQMLTWTIILGAVFVVSVLHDRILPEFDNITLALLGISNGTYLGFRLFAEKDSPAKPSGGKVEDKGTGASKTEEDKKKETEKKDEKQG